ncbi:hypothetical protein CBL_00831 [Carabus blaptoides fortunei]
MALLPGTFNLEKNENFVEYLTGIGLPEDKAKQFNLVVSPLVVKVDGQKITLCRQVQGDTEFTLGQEFEEKMPTGHVLKSIGTLNNNVLTIKSTTPDGKSGEKIYEFTAGGLVVTLKAETTPVVAKRTYKRA